MAFRNPVTHKPLVVSPASTDIIIRALVAAHRAGAITDEQYTMTYAEVCEIGYCPQAFGGRKVPSSTMAEWQQRVWP